MFGVGVLLFRTGLVVGLWFRVRVKYRGTAVISGNIKCPGGSNGRHL